jgi:hypothetical protein
VCEKVKKEKVGVRREKKEKKKSQVERVCVRRERKRRVKKKGKKKWME